jgi:hypothetical protein
MEIPAVSGIIHLLFALLADGDVRRNIDLTAGLLTFYDRKRLEHSGILHRFLINLQDRGTAGRMFVEECLKGLDLCGCPLGENLHIGALVTDTAADPGGLGVTIHRRAETDALHDSIYTKTHGCNATHGSVFLSGRMSLFLQEYRCGFQIAADFVKIPLLCKNTVAI